MSQKRISFKDSDYRYPHLENKADEIANFIKSSKFIMQLFLELMQATVSIDHEKYKTFLPGYFKRLIKNRKTEAPDVLKFEELAYEFFSVCNSKEEVLKMRGLVPEKVFEDIFQQRHKEKSCRIGFGVSVWIDGEKVVYDPERPYEDRKDSDVFRQTVDGAYWDGNFGEFAEIKLKPESFKTKDIGYLRKLSGKLGAKDINFIIFLVAFGNKDLIYRQLVRLGLSSKVEELESEFNLVGIHELDNLKIAA